MMDKIMTIPTTPAAASPAASKARVATQAQAKDPRSKATAEDPTATAFAAAMLVAGQQPVSNPVVAPQAQVQGQAAGDAQAKDATNASTQISAKISKEALQASAAEGKALEGKSSAETIGSAAPSLMQARMAASTGANAGAMVAGLQPRSSAVKLPADSTSHAMLEGTHSMKEWVFDGVEGNPNLRSLFGAQVGAKAGENLLGKVQSEQQMRGEMADGIESLQPQAIAPAGANASISAQSMTSAQGNTLPQGSGMGLQAHVAIERPQGNVVPNNGSSTLSGAEFLSTLSSLKGGQNVASQGQSGAGSFGREGGKAGLRSGVSFGEAKKTKTALDGEAGFDALAQSGASAAGVSGSAMLSGAKTDITGKSAETPSFVQAQVTTGSMAQDRIASASLAGISSNIRNFAAQGQGGEIRVKLHPENLGELHLRVVTDGKQVGIQIQASDEKAKKILEESLSDLKDSLSKHQLSLGTVDFAVGNTQGTFSSDMGNDARQNQTHNPFGGMQDMMNGGGDRSNQWSGAQDGAQTREGWNASSLRTAVPGGRAATQMASASSNSSGAGVATSRRLDVRA